jgi:hypothetical protein
MREDPIPIVNDSRQSFWEHQKLRTKVNAAVLTSFAGLDMSMIFAGIKMEDYWNKRHNATAPPASSTLRPHCWAIMRGLPWAAAAVLLCDSAIARYLDSFNMEKLDGPFKREIFIYAMGGLMYALMPAGCKHARYANWTMAMVLPFVGGRLPSFINDNKDFFSSFPSLYSIPEAFPLPDPSNYKVL